MAMECSNRLIVLMHWWGLWGTDDQTARAFGQPSTLGPGRHGTIAENPRMRVFERGQG